MNAPAALRVTARRAGRFNLWALVAIVAMFGVFAVKASVEHRSLPTRHFMPAGQETALEFPRWTKVEKP